MQPFSYNVKDLFHGSHQKVIKAPLLLRTFHNIFLLFLGVCNQDLGAFSRSNVENDTNDSPLWLNTL